MSLLERLVADRAASRIAQRDTSIFAPASAPASLHDAIRNRLGWLDAPTKMRGDLARLREFAERAWADGITDVCLLGMGGSSLCAEVLRDGAPRGARGTRLIVLDTTDERTILDAADSLTPAKTLFIVASKSGTTIEVSSLERYFGWIVARDLEAATGRQFVAITDPGTPLIAQAKERGYRETFINPADIGGRYSALSLFGLTPAALLGVDLDALLAAGERMASACASDRADNPGLALGAFMAESALAGRDKLTVLLPSALAPLGAWIEQLVAESTGKQGRGLLPVVDEPPGIVDEYGTDRAFVVVEDAESPALAQSAAALQSAGHAVFRIDARGLGEEFFRWEFATAVAGAGLGINPFDEPNVREAKTRTQALLDAFRATGALRVDPPVKPLEGVTGCLVREHHARRDDGPNDFKGRYVAILDYLPADRARSNNINDFRRRVRGTSGAATTYGIGPRYLHSTGQYHKGGPNTGLFLLLTGPDATATVVPGTDYSFSVLKQAQALGDFEALVAAGRDVVHCHVEDPAAVIPALDRLVRSRGVFGD